MQIKYAEAKPGAGHQKKNKSSQGFKLVTVLSVAISSQGSGLPVRSSPEGFAKHALRVTEG